MTPTDALGALGESAIQPTSLTNHRQPRRKAVYGLLY